MTDQAATPTYSVEVRRTFAAPREKVFAAWTDPATIAQWHAGADHQTVVAEYDLRVGGNYRYEFKNAQTGDVKPVWGSFREVSSPERLVYTWNLTGDAGKAEDTIVTVEFHDRGKQTEIILRHELFLNTEIRDLHEQGWNGCFDRLIGGA